MIGLPRVAEQVNQTKLSVNTKQKPIASSKLERLSDHSLHTKFSNASRCLILQGKNLVFSPSTLGRLFQLASGQMRLSRV